MKDHTHINIFLDDLRQAPVNYNMTFKTAEALLSFMKETLPNLENTHINVLSLDHDLGLDIMDGYDFVKAFAEIDIHVNRIQLHTSNIVGFKNMYHYLLNAQAHGLISKDIKIEPRTVSVINGIETILYRPI